MQVAVVMPCYNSGKQIINLISEIPECVTHIYCVDDACPEETGTLLQQKCHDSRIRILHHEKNQGVGGAMVTGYKQALQDGADIIIKLDSDGQMDPGLIPRFIAPIVAEEADYTKGNRFYRLESLTGMPGLRLCGNAVLSFMSKFSTGYWRLFDPNNGFTAIHAKVLKLIPLSKISHDYFFESDMLFRLNTLRAVVIDIPMNAKYGDENSSLNIHKNIFIFLYKHLRNFAKRIFYNYYLRDFNVASIEWLAGPLLLFFGVCYGSLEWAQSISQGTAATAGTVMLAALPTLIGIQLTLSAMSYDIENTPAIPLSKLLNSRRVV
ncbi:MAG: glycosyltransferase family 2 protein [Gammaproteobacteria bacterium]